jgi:integrase
MGTPHPVRRRVAAVELSPEQTLALIAALPEWSTSRKVTPFAVRGRFEVAYETSLRPSTLDRIEAPDHYRAGESLLRLSDDTDKARWGRDVPLTERARAALDAVLARHGEGYTGPIFGEHDYTTHIRRAAFQVLPRELAERFCGAHLRSATITHLLERPHASLPGVQHMAGHKLTSTTSRYVRPSLRAARETIDRPTADAPTEKK